MKYLIRPGEPADRAMLSNLVTARAEWMHDHGHPRWRGLARSADTLAGQLGEPDVPMWVLTTTNGTLLGSTIAYPDTPPLGWTEQEQAEPATFLVSTVTHPGYAGNGVGTVIAFWALDHAARQGHHWVRRGVLTDSDGANRELIRYYRSQGWRVVRAIKHPHRPDITVWSLARPAEPQPQLADVVQEADRASV